MREHRKVCHDPPFHLRCLRRHTPGLHAARQDPREVNILSHKPSLEARVCSLDSSLNHRYGSLFLLRSVSLVSRCSAFDCSLAHPCFFICFPEECEHADTGRVEGDLRATGLVDTAAGPVAVGVARGFLAAYRLQLLQGCPHASLGALAGGVLPHRPPSRPAGKAPLPQLPQLHAGTAGTSGTGAKGAFDSDGSGGSSSEVQILEGRDRSESHSRPLTRILSGL